MTVVSVDVSMNVATIGDFIVSLPTGTKRAAHKAYAEYIVGNDQHGLRHEPAYKEVSRTRAYGRPFQTAKQRNWFFWALNTGQIHPGQNNRTHAMQNGWKLTDNGNIRNDTPGIKWVMGDGTQANQPNLVGWRVAGDIARTNHKGAIRAAQKSANEWIKKNRKI